MKIAVYSCNFGNYRNELKTFNSLDSTYFDSQISYYFFTDDIRLQSKHWKIIYTLLLKPDYTIDKNRLTSKYIKFILPEVLKKYDILIWIDNKQLKHKVLYKNIIELLEKNPEYDIFNLQHPVRTDFKDEILETIRLKVENKDYVNTFLEKVKDFKSPFLLPETCVIIRKNTDSVNDVFKHCYNLLLTYKLKRDQNIYNYAFYEKNIIPLVLPSISDLLNIGPLP